MSIRKSYSSSIYDIQLPIVYMREANGFSPDKVNIQVENESKYDIGKFPHTIKELFWTKKGQPGGDPWFGLGSLTTGLYFFLTAGTPSKETLWSGGTGYIQVYLAQNFNNLIQFTMAEQIRNLYISETH
jgi:hypothetical protein